MSNPVARPAARPAARPGEIEDFLLRHDVFVREARDAAHQALWYLGFVHPSTSARLTRAAEAYLPFALRQVRALVRGVYLRLESYDACRKALDSASSAAPAAEDLVPLAPGEIEKAGRALSVFDAWHVLFARLDELPAEQGFELAADLRTGLRGFLERSLPTAGWRHALGRWIMPRATLAEVRRSLGKNLALLWGLALLVFVLAKVEAVSSLVANDGWWSLLPFVLLAMPVLVTRVLVHRRCENQLPQHFWDFGGPAFRRVVHQAREPRRPLVRWPPETTLRSQLVLGHAVKMAVYLAWWFVSFGILVALHGFDLVGSSVITVFLVLTLFYLMLISAHLLDFWDYVDPLPVRFLGLVGAVVVVLLMSHGGGHPVFLASAAAGAAYFAWRWWQARSRWGLAALAAACLAVAVMIALGWSASGKDVWRDARGAAAQPRLALGEWPHGGGEGPPVVVVAASGGGSRAAVFTSLLFAELHRERSAAELAERPELAEVGRIAANLQAVASVSGGSLANAAYLARRVRGAEIDDLPEDVAADYLLPTLRGALWPLSSRGQEIEAVWESEESADLGTLRLSQLVARWRAGSHDPAPPFPVPLFNSTTLDGHAVVISPLARNLYRAPSQRISAELYEHRRLAERLPPGLPGDQSYTWVYYRDALYGLEDLLPAYDPRLAQAVRASANFPFGFPLIEVETRQRLLYSPDDPPDSNGRADRIRTAYLTDGGALSNSGVWSLYHLLTDEGLQRTLKRRGVLLIVVEASKMPQYPLGGSLGAVQRMRLLLGAIQDQAPVGQALHHRMLDVLEARYGDRLAVVQYDLPPAVDCNVLTTWALAKGKKQLLRESFEVAWTRELDNLLRSWRVLESRGAPGERPHIARERPPLD